MESEAVYDTTELYGDRQVPEVVEVSFELSYRGWCRLQKSPAWEALLSELGECQGIDRNERLPRKRGEGKWIQENAF